MDSRTQISALSRAAGILGGQPALRRYLNVSAVCLGFWMAGTATTPPDVFLKIVDLIVEKDISDLKSRHDPDLG